MTDLNFMRLSDERRGHITELIRTRLLSDRARQFLQLALDGADSVGPSGFRVRYFADALLVSGRQERIGELLNCSARTVQRMFSGELAACVETRQVTVQDESGQRVPVVVYCVLLDELALMPGADPCDEFDQLILSAGPHLFELRESRRESVARRVAPPVVPVVVPPVACPVVPVAGGLSHAIFADVVSLMNHDHDLDHERMNERKKVFSLERKHNEQHQPRPEQTQPESQRDESAPGTVTFNAIEIPHLLAIAGMTVPCKDQTLRIAPFSQRLRLLDAYLADAVAHGRAEPHERADLLALFHHVAHREDITSRARWLFTVWNNRKYTGKSMMDVLRPANRAYAREVLATESPKGP